MVRMLIDERVGARVRVNRVRANEVRSGDTVPQVAVDGVDEKQFAVLIPIVAPRIGAPAAQSLHGFALRMVAPDRAAHGNALLRWRARNSDFGGTRRAAATVKPAVGTETQTAGEGMMVLRRHGETVEHHLGCAIRHIVT